MARRKRKHLRAWMDYVESDLTSFLLIDGNNGIDLLPLDVLSQRERDWVDKNLPKSGSSIELDEIPAELRDYTENYRGGVQIERKHGWIARYTEPGYMDATPWVWGDSEREVTDLLKESYGSEDEGD